jgi:hypothetical protein
MDTCPFYSYLTFNIATTFHNFVFGFTMLINFDFIFGYGITLFLYYMLERSLFYKNDGG